ncbi:hypothetical protein Tco_0549065 [Tanacetum coccineum]
MNEGSHNSSVGISPVRYHTPSRRPRVQDRLGYNDGNVLATRDPSRISGRSQQFGEPFPTQRTTSATVKSSTMHRDTGIGSQEITGKTLEVALAYLGAARRKHVKDPVEIHNIKQRDGETIEEFMERFKVETGRMKGAPECMKISGFLHGVNNPELTKRLNERVPKTLEEMMTTTTAFIRGETAAASKKKSSSPSLEPRI